MFRGGDPKRVQVGSPVYGKWREIYGRNFKSINQTFKQYFFKIKW